MKIECVRDKLVEAVSKAEKITGKNLTLPVLGCVLMEAKGRELVIKATNLDLGIEITIPVKVEKEGIVAVPGQVLTGFLSNITEESNVSLESIEGNIKISTKNHKTTIKSLPTEDFPSIPKVVDGKNITLSGNEFIKGIKSVWYSSAISSMKPELSSVYVYSDGDELVFVATDSFRLAEKRVSIKQAREFGSLLIPVKNVSEIVRILESSKEQINISITKNQISFSFNGVYLTSRVVDGVFPDYKQIIPKGHKTSIKVLKQDLINTLKIATIFSDKFNKLSIKSDGKKLELSTKNADVGETTNNIEAVQDGENVDINFNYRYITDCFQSIESDSINFQFNGQGKPLVVLGVNDKSFTYIVMPINK